MKYIIIILIILFLFFVVSQENYDVSANLNLLTNSELRFNNPVVIPAAADPTDDIEIPNEVLFDQRLNMTMLQKLKAINNILERIKDISITESNSKKLDGNTFSNVVTFNPALLPVKTYEPDQEKLNDLNNLITQQLKYYSGDQYVLKIRDVDTPFAAETDDQYRIGYRILGTIDGIDLKLIVDLIVIKSSTTETDLSIVFTELRIDNPNVYITPNANPNSDKYVSINDYSKSLK